MLPAHLCERKIVSTTTSTVVGRLRSPTCHPFLQTPVRMANHPCLPTDPRKFCSTNGQISWNRIQGVRVHILVGEATETPSRRSSLAGVGISLLTHPTYYRSMSLHLSGRGGPGIWILLGWTRVTREMGKVVGEKVTPPHRRLLLHILQRSPMEIPGGGVETKAQDDGHLCPMGAPHLGISCAHLHLRRCRLLPRLGLHTF
jgi:hypothetical protein